MGHRAGLFRYPGPSPGCRTRTRCAGSSRRCPPAAISRLRVEPGRSQPEPAFQGDGRKMLGAGGAALRGALAAQLGPRRFQRSRRACWTSSPTSAARRHRPQSAARAVLRPAGLLRQPVFAEQPAVSQSALHRRRGDRGIRPRSCRKRCRTTLLGLREAELVDYPAVARAQARRVARGLSEFAATAAARHAAQDFAAYRRRARPRAGVLRRVRDAAAEAFRAMVGMAGAMAQAHRRRRCDKLRESHPDELGFHEFLQWNAERQLERCRDIARARGLSIGLYLDTAIGVDAGGADAWMDQGIMLRGLRSARRPTSSIRPARIGA